MLREDVPSRINGIVTATATLTNVANDNGVLVLESTLRITAVEASVVTCEGASGDTESIEFSISGKYTVRYVSHFLHWFECLACNTHSRMSPV